MPFSNLSLPPLVLSQLPGLMQNTSAPLLQQQPSELLETDALFPHPSSLPLCSALFASDSFFLPAGEELAVEVTRHYPGSHVRLGLLLASLPGARRSDCILGVEGSKVQPQLAVHRSCSYSQCPCLPLGLKETRADSQG